MKKHVLMLTMAAMIISLCFAGRPAWAANLEFTDSLTTALNKTAEQAGGTLKSKLTKQYADLSKLQSEDTALQGKISELHYSNEARLTAARKKIKEIDADKIRKLDDQVKAAKSKYQPLFNSYSSVSKQAAAAKKLKDKTLYKLLQTQADGLKVAVTLAKQDIKNKESSLKTAKSEKTNKAAEIRKILNETDPQKTKIKSEKSSISASNKSISTEWSNFKAAVKKSDAGRTSDTLARLYTLSSQVLKNKQNIYSLEQKISASIKKAEDKLR